MANIQSFERSCTSFNPVSKSKAPAAKRALYSPRLWPTTKSGVLSVCDIFNHVKAFTVYNDKLVKSPILTNSQNPDSIISSSYVDQKYNF